MRKFESPLISQVGLLGCECF